MDDPLDLPAPLLLLARLYRERRSGVISIGPPETVLRLLLRDGQVAGMGPVSGPPSPRHSKTRPHDSARLRLERLLAEIGIRSKAPAPAAAPAPAPPPRTLRGRLLESLASNSLTASFEEGADAPADVAATAGATEPLILEAVRQLRDSGTVRAALGDLDQRLVATGNLADERTLTLTEGYLLSRIDGVTSAHQVLQLVPLDPDETERTLLGLVLTGRVECRATPVPRQTPRSNAEAIPPLNDADEPVLELVEEPGGPDGVPPEELEPLAIEIEELSPPPEARAHLPPSELDREAIERRKEILEIFQSLPIKNHFEVLGVDPGCSDAQAKRAYTALAKRYHPDVHRDPRLDDLHDILEQILIRVGEAWEVLGDSRSRAAYEARFNFTRKPQGTAPPPEPGSALPRPPQQQQPADDTEHVHPEDTLFKARLLLSQERFPEAMSLLESTVPQMEERRHQLKGHILLAKAYAKNPNWVRRAEETLQYVMREDPANADAHYELGLVYKAGGLTARAQAMFRRVLELRPDHREAAAELSPGESPSGGLLKRLFGRGKSP